MAYLSTGAQRRDTTTTYLQLPPPTNTYHHPPLPPYRYLPNFWHQGPQKIVKIPTCFFFQLLEKGYLENPAAGRNLGDLKMLISGPPDTKSHVINHPLPVNNNGINCKNTNKDITIGSIQLTKTAENAMRRKTLKFRHLHGINRAHKPETRLTTEMTQRQNRLH